MRGPCVVRCSRPNRLVRAAVALQPSTILRLQRALTTREYRRLFSSTVLKKPGAFGRRSWQRSAKSSIKVGPMPISVMPSLFCLCGCSVLMSSCVGATSPEPGGLDPVVGPPPVAEKRPKTITVHGDSRVDDYFWLRDKDDPESDGVPEGRGRLCRCGDEADGRASRTRCTRRWSATSRRPTTPSPTGAATTSITRERRRDSNIRSTAAEGCSLTAPEEVLLDLNEMAKGQPFMALGAFEPSDDGTLLAFSTDNTGYRQYTLHVKNLHDRRAAARSHRARRQRRRGPPTTRPSSMSPKTP